MLIGLFVYLKKEDVKPFESKLFISGCVNFALEVELADYTGYTIKSVNITQFNDSYPKIFVTL